MRWSGHALDTADQSTRPDHGIADGQSRRGAFAELQLLPPAGGMTGNHRGGHLPLRSLLAQIQQLAQAGIVLTQQLKLRRLLQRCGRLDPFPLGRAGPEGSAEQGVGIENTGALAPTHQHQQPEKTQPWPEATPPSPAGPCLPGGGTHGIRPSRCCGRTQGYREHAADACSPPEPGRSR